MEITWTGSITIAAPVERVYTYLADFPRHAEWAQSLVRLHEVKAGDSRGVGRVYRTAERQNWQDDRRPGEPISHGVAGVTMCEVRDLVPNCAVVWHSWAPYPGVTHTGDY